MCGIFSGIYGLAVTTIVIMNIRERVTLIVEWKIIPEFGLNIW